MDIFAGKRNMKDETYFPKVTYDALKFSDSQYQRGEQIWKASTLVEYVKKQKLKPFKFPLACVDLAQKQRWMEDLDMDEFGYQCKRVMSCNIEYPIILDEYGQIADGFHRVIKALCMGKGYIMAYRLYSMPPCDKEEKR